MKIKHFLLALVLIWSVSVVAAQDATTEPTSGVTTLSYGVPVTGTIDNAAFTETWTLQTASADRISVVVERTDGNLIPDVSILDTNDQPINQSYGADRSQALARIDNYTLPAAGTYQVQVGRDAGEAGLTEGAYTLTIIPLATAEDNPNNIVPLGEIAYGEPVQGEITATQWINRYTLNAPAPDTIRITADRVSGTLFPEVEIQDVNGASIRTGYTDSEGDQSTVDVTLPNPGQYTIIVRRDRGFTGETTGVYQLIVDLLGAGVGSPVLAAPLETITYDTPVTGELVDGRWYQDWQLTTQAGDTLSISIERTEGNLQPEVVLLGGSGQELRRGYVDGTNAQTTLDRYQLDVPGTYTVRAQRAREQAGTSEGSYSMTVTLIGTGAGSPALTAESGTVENGTPVDGELTNVNWLNTWAYTAAADERVDIVVTRTDGTLIPRVAIQDANGQNLREAYPEVTGDVVIIRDFAIPTAGTYRIVVFRLDEQNGYTTGAYTLAVRPPEQ